MAKSTVVSAAKLSLGESMEARAIALATKVAENPAIDQEADNQANLKEQTDTGPVRLVLELRKTFELEDFPVPGSDIETVEEGYNGLVDNYKVAKTSADGKSKTQVKRSFYVAFADATKHGKEIVTELSYLATLSNPQMNIDHIPADIRNAYQTNKVARMERQTYLEGRRGTVRKAYKKAIQLWYAMDEIAGLQDAICTFLYTDKDKVKVKATSKPIRIQTKSDPLSDWDDYSVNAVINMDVEKARENGGTHKALQDTLRKGKQEGGDDSGKDKPQLIRTVETWSARMTDIHDAIRSTWTDGDNKELRNKILAKLLSDDGDDLLLSMEDIRSTLETWLSANSIQTKLEALQEKRAKAA